MKITQREPTSFPLRMQPAMRHWVQKKAAEDERSQNWLLVKIIGEAMSRDEQHKQA